MKTTKMHNHYNIEYQGKIYYRFSAGSWYEKKYSDYVYIKSYERLEKMFKEVTGEKD